jgi:hypothetical protein
MSGIFSRKKALDNLLGLFLPKSAFFPMILTSEAHISSLKIRLEM